MDLDYPRTTAMRNLLIISALASLAIAGCATQGDAQYAKADCKVAQITTASATGVRSPPPVDSLRQREAEMQLSASDYRRSQLARNGMANNNVEDLLRDCY
jgi:hypothetical protein